jgi:hypothetical protein
MKQSIVMGIIRAVLASVGGALASSGWVDEASAKEMAGALLIIIAGVWSAVEKYQARKGSAPVAPVGLLVLGLAGLMMTTGCLSYMGTQAHNGRVEQKILQAQAMPDGKGVYLAVNVLELTKGYFGAWSEAPGTMAAATIGDLLTSGAAAYLLLKKDDGGGSGKGGGDVTVNGDGNTTVVTSGDGSSTSHNESNTSEEK